MSSTNTNVHRALLQEAAAAGHRERARPIADRLWRVREKPEKCGQSAIEIKHLADIVHRADR